MNVLILKAENVPQVQQFYKSVDRACIHSRNHKLQEISTFSHLKATGRGHINSTHKNVLVNTNCVPATNRNS